MDVSQRSGSSWGYGNLNHDATVVQLNAQHSLWVVKHGAFSWVNVVTHVGELELGNWQWWPNIMDLPASHRHVPVVVALDDTRVLGFFNDDYYSYLQVVEIDGTTVSGGERVQLSLASFAPADSAVSNMVKLADGRVLLVYDADGSSVISGDQRVKGRIITISGTTVSVGGAQAMDDTPFASDVGWTGTRFVWLAASGTGVLMGIAHNDGSWIGNLQWYTIDGDTITLRDTVQLYEHVSGGDNVKVAVLDDIHFVAQMSIESVAYWYYVTIIGNQIQVGERLGPLGGSGSEGFRASSTSTGYWNIVGTGPNGVVTGLANSDLNLGVYSLNIGANTLSVGRVWQPTAGEAQPEYWLDIAAADTGFVLVTWVYTGDYHLGAQARLCRVGTGAGAVGIAQPRAVRVFSRDQSKLEGVPG